MASLRMVQGNIKKNPPSSYQIGEQVFLRVKDKGGVTRGGKPLSRPLVYLAKIIDENKKTFIDIKFNMKTQMEKL